MFEAVFSAGISFITQVFTSLALLLNLQPTYAAFEDECAFLTTRKAFYLRLIDPDVVRLQRLLNLDPETRIAETGPGSPGYETTKYGVGTFLAVQRFQEKYKEDILSPYGLTKATGKVGAATKTKLLELCEDKVSDSSSVPRSETQNSSVMERTNIAPTVSQSLSVVAQKITNSPTFFDQEPPEVSFVTTAGSATGTVYVTLEVAARDNDQIANVELYINSTLSGSKYSRTTNGTYLLDWNTMFYSDGDYKLIAVAYDRSGNRGSSQELALSLSKGSAPTETAAEAAAALVPMAYLIPMQGTVSPGQSTTINWFANNVSACRGSWVEKQSDGSLGTVSNSGTITTGPLFVPTEYYLQCDGTIGADARVLIGVQ